jgi:hypothetical protein
MSAELHFVACKNQAFYMNHGHSREHWALSRTVLACLWLHLRSLILNSPIDWQWHAWRGEELKLRVTLSGAVNRGHETLEKVHSYLLQSLDGSVSILMVCNDARFLANLYTPNPTATGAFQCGVLRLER